MVPAAILTSVLAAVATAAPAPATLGPVKLPLTRYPVPADQTHRSGRIKSANAGDNSGEAPAWLTRWGRDLKYTAPVSFGTPPRQFELQIDTGSSLLWVQDFGSAEIQQRLKDEGQENEPVPPFYFDHRNSSTFKYTSGPDSKQVAANITYLKGDTKGWLATDVVGIAGQSLPDQTFLSAYTWSADQDANKDNVTGILGLGLPYEGGPKKGPDPLNLPLRLSKLWKDKRFGVYLSRDSKDPKAIAEAVGHPEFAGPGGELTLGGVDESRFTGDIHYVPAVGGNPNFTTHWSVGLDAITLGGKPSPAVKAGDPAVLDTGATIIVAPRATVAEFYKGIPGAELNFLAQLMTGNDIYNVPCNTTFDVEVKIGGQSWPIDNSDLFFVHAGEDVPGGCFGAIAGADINFWLLGDTFLKNVYTVYSYEPKQIGFAKLKE